VPDLGPAVMTSYDSQGIQQMQIQTVQPGTAPQMQFFRLQLQ
jgi:hypothetical protein